MLWSHFRKRKMKQEEAEWLYEFLTDHADLNEDGDPDELDKSEA